MSSSSDEVKVRLNQLRADKALLQAQLASLRRIPEVQVEAREPLEVENHELGQQLRTLEDKAILYRSSAWTCFEIDLDVGRRARLARRNEADSAAADKDGDLALGVRLDTFWRGRFYEPYYLVFARPSQMLESLPQLDGTAAADADPNPLADGLRLIRHTVPHFVPLHRLVEKYLPSVLGGEMSGGAASASRDNEAGGLTMLAQFSDLPGVHAFLSDLHCHLQAYVSRRQQAMALRHLDLPGAPTDVKTSAVDALGTEAFDLVKITWPLPSSSAARAAADEQEEPEDGDVDAAANPTAAAVRAAAKRKREMPGDEARHELEVVVRYRDLQSDRLVDETRPTGLFSTTSEASDEEQVDEALRGLRRPYGEVRVELLEYAPELESRQRRTPGISRADLRALRPEAQRREDLEHLYAQQHDGESLDMDEAFLLVAKRVWSQLDQKAPASEARGSKLGGRDGHEWAWISRRQRRLLRARIDPSLYRSSPADFRQLASRYASTFGRFVTDEGGYEAKLDFQDAEALRCLAETLLQHDFGIHATLSRSNLCPTIPNRLAYVALVHELLCWSLPTSQLLRYFVQGADAFGETDTVTGLDIGTGASAIYPVLATTCLPSWRFLATDVDRTSLGYASTNIVDHATNNPPTQHNVGLRDKIALLHAQDGTTFVPDVGDKWTQVGGALAAAEWRKGEVYFTMCNPPFYSSWHDMHRSASFKHHPPNAVCHGSASEMVVEGGEVEFVRRMVRESTTQGKGRVVWWTCMLGKLASVVQLASEVKTLARQGAVGGWGVHELPTGGGKTKRWVLFWTSTPLRLCDDLARRNLPAALERILPVATERKSRTFALGPRWTRREMHHLMLELLGAIDGCYVYASSYDAWSVAHQSAGSRRSGRLQEPGTLDVVVTREGWSRRARRAKLQATAAATREPEEGRVTQPLLMARVTLAEVTTSTARPEGSTMGIEVRVHWTYGMDAARFESLAMFLLSAIERRVGELGELGELAVE